MPEARVNVMLDSMMRRIGEVAVAIAVLACTVSGAAQDKGYWRAASTNATSITGDMVLADFKVTIDYFVFNIAPIRKLHPAEVAAAFDADVNAGIEGDLYRLDVPAAKRFLHHNTLCGTDQTQWMATYVTGRTLQVAFFSGLDAPVFTIDALQNSPDLCGRFSYSR